MTPESATSSADSPPPRVSRERRSGGDRRRPNGSRRRQPMTGRMKTLITVLVISLLASISSTLFFIDGSGDDAGDVVIVRVDGTGTWSCSPAALAYYFASQDQLLDRTTAPVSDDIQRQKITLRTKALLDRNETLLRRVGEMEWDDFERLATSQLVASKSADLTEDDYRQALRSAHIR